jgi:hypothetical protein
MDVCPWFIYVVLSCVDTGLATGWSLVQGVLLYVVCYDYETELMEARFHIGLYSHWWWWWWWWMSWELSGWGFLTQSLPRGIKENRSSGKVPRYCWWKSIRSFTSYMSTGEQNGFSRHSEVCCRAWKCLHFGNFCCANMKGLFPNKNLFVLNITVLLLLRYFVMVLNNHLGCRVCVYDVLNSLIFKTTAICKREWSFPLHLA